MELVLTVLAFGMQKLLVVEPKNALTIKMEAVLQLRIAFQIMM